MFGSVGGWSNAAVNQVLVLLYKINFYSSIYNCNLEGLSNVTVEQVQILFHELVSFLSSIWNRSVQDRSNTTLRQIQILWHKFANFLNSIWNYIIEAQNRLSSNSKSDTESVAKRCQLQEQQILVGLTFLLHSRYQQSLH